MGDNPNLYVKVINESTLSIIFDNLAALNVKVNYYNDDGNVVTFMVTGVNSKNIVEIEEDESYNRNRSDTKSVIFRFKRNN